MDRFRFSVRIATKPNPIPRTLTEGKINVLESLKTLGLGALGLLIAVLYVLLRGKEDRIKDQQHKISQLTVEKDLDNASSKAEDSKQKYLDALAEYDKLRNSSTPSSDDSST